jgi:GNAT superfamily N-acetyltransferase
MLRALGDRTAFVFTPETYLRDGFGAHPAFSGFVAERAGEVIGYLLYNFGYDTDSAMRLMWVIDLFVDETHRRHGVGEALMRAAVSLCRQDGVGEMVWAVFFRNTLAFQFYERLGAKRIEELTYMYWPIPEVSD